MYKWSLNESHFTILDRINLALFFLTPSNRWTMDKHVKSFESEMANFVGSKYAVFVSSGSTANTILACYLKDSKKSVSDSIRKIIFPSTTWTTSISPFIREGFEPVFVDINLSDFSMNLDSVENALSKDKSIEAVFITSLLGFVPDIERLEKISKKYKVRVLMDNCENTFGSFGGKNASSFFTSTTSTYFGHQLQSVEGGFIFTNDDEEYNYFLLARNHGLVRALPNDQKSKFSNKDVNDKFDFFLLGNNYRNSDIHALIGRMDLKRVDKYISSRIDLFNYFKESVPSEKLLLPDEFLDRDHVAFCIPIVFKKDVDLNSVLKECEDNSIETRPIISGNLLRQTCYKQFGDYKNFPNSEFLHNNGFYVGLHPKVTKNQIDSLITTINKYA